MTHADEARPEARLLRKAIEVIAHKGLDGLDVRGLADEAGTSTSQFVRFYGHKDALVAAVFDEGWAAIERHVSLRLFKPSSNIEELVAALLDGVVDALEAEREAVSAALLIAHASVGRKVPAQVKGTPAHRRFFVLVRELRAALANELTAQEALEITELLYGAALHRLVLATPMAKERAPAFDRGVFINLMHRMARSVLGKD